MKARYRNIYKTEASLSICFSNLLHRIGVHLILSVVFSPVGGEFLQIVVHINGIRLPKMNELLQGLVDEDDADERGEGFLREARDVTDE